MPSEISLKKKTVYSKVHNKREVWSQNFPHLIKLEFYSKTKQTKIVHIPNFPEK
jgi:hypothetical protein